MRYLQTNSGGAVYWFQQKGLQDRLLTCECVEIGSAEDEQDKTGLRVCVCVFYNIAIYA